MATPERSSPAAVAVLTAVAMVAFAANSLLCREALLATDIDAASFTTIRLASGAALLWPLARRRGGATGSWRGAIALLAYAAGFSFAYRTLTAATGALLLFGAVQVTMIGDGLRRGERLHRRQWLGSAVAVAGLVALLLPGLSTPPLPGAALMLGAGVAWGAYSLLARGAGDPMRATAGNFVRAAVVTLAVTVGMVGLGRAELDATGCAYAVASGALASGLGYAVWYAALRALAPASAATIQLSVPVLTALGGAWLLGETLTTRLLLTGAAILGGIALVVVARRPAPAATGS